MAQWCPVLTLDRSAVDEAIVVVYSPEPYGQAPRGPYRRFDRLLDGEALEIASRLVAGPGRRGQGTMSVERKQDG